MRTRHAFAALFIAAACSVFVSPVGATAAVAAVAPRASAGPVSDATAHYTPAGCNVATQEKDVARCFATVYTAVPGRIAADANRPPPGALSPAQIQSMYHLPSAGAGQGQTVAVVVAFGDTHAETDLATFRAEYGMLPCTTLNGCFTKVDQNGGTNYPADDTGWALETSLDLDAVSAACPNCHIMLVEANDSSLFHLGAAVDRAVALGAKFVSNSYGALESSVASDSLDHFYTHAGVVVTAGTGDVGGVPSWPATDPNVVAVGGTSLTADASSRGWHESAWTGGGSGCSIFEQRPAYQSAITTACGNRAVADISADADPSSGLAVYDTLGQDGWLQVGGTSLATPLITAMYALAGTPVAGTFPVTYPYASAPSHLFDITEGSNQDFCGTVLCNAGAGWDGPTGLGTPDGVQALGLHNKGDLVGKVVDGATGAPLAGARVSTAEGFTATTDASGRFDLAVPAGTYTVTAQATGYQPKTASGVVVTAGGLTTIGFKLTRLL